MIDKEQASERLRSLRQCTAFYTYLSIKEIQEAVQHGKFTYTDIGTSEEELRKLHVKNNRHSAQWTLDRMRNSQHPSLSTSGLIANIQIYLNEVGLSLADIGTNEEELEAMRVRYEGPRK